MDKERKKIKSEAEKEDAGVTNREKWIKKRERQIMTSEAMIHMFKAKKNATQKWLYRKFDKGKG